MPRVVVIMVAVALVMVTACERAPTPSAPPGPPKPASPRLVALSPGIAATARDAGLGGLLVGRHGWDAWSDQSLPVCGDNAGLDYEALIRVHPTHILIERSATPPPARLGDLAAANGWTIVEFPLLALSDIPALVSGLHALAPAADPSEFDRLTGEMARAWSVNDPSLAPIGGVLLLSAAAPKTYALGPGSWHHQILASLGATPALTEGSPYVSLDAEDVLRLRPAAILLIIPRRPSEPSRTGPLPVSEFPAALGVLATLDLPAVTSRRVALIDDPEGLLPSTGMIRIADDMRTILRAWLPGVERNASPN
ncbi:MAG: hypothetical protein KF745_12405 [Phycisphaeraceae bacterium]|nr:hypothetical protein [Phycisphaeraceae bacterium]